ncbi:MAG: lysophospholipid acyltransferase family protein [Lacibacter sp.]
MNVFKSIAARIWALWAVLLFAATMLLIVLIPALLTGGVREPLRTKWFIQLSRLWMKIFLPLIGVRLTIKGKKHFRPNENYVVVCNHNSFMDVPVTSTGIPGTNKTIAKIEMSRIPVFGIIYKRGSVLVDRKNDDSRAKSYSAMKEVLQLGMHMCIYPEGTRNKTAQPLKEFKDGAFRLAIETGKPIMPGVLFNTRNIIPANKTFYCWPGKVEMHFLEPIDVKNYKPEDTKALKEKVYRIMWDHFESCR